MSGLIELFGDFEPGVREYLVAAAEMVSKSESSIPEAVWRTGMALEKAFERCPRGQWSEACERMGIDERRALSYRQAYQRWPIKENVPKLGKDLLLTLAAPSVPEQVIESIAQRVETGETVSSREAAAEVSQAKANAPAEFNHDIDRTSQEPNLETADGREAVEAIIKKIRAQVAKGVAICVQLKSESAWLLLQQSLENMAEDVKNS